MGVAWCHQRDHRCSHVAAAAIAGIVDSGRRPARGARAGCDDDAIGLRQNSAPLDRLDRADRRQGTALMVELAEYLEDEALDGSRRERAAALLSDLLEPLEVTTIEVRLPADGRARTVAEALLLDPTENRTLSSWGREVGASGRTLERAFLAETGVPFSRWRTLARLKASLPLLAAGRSISYVAPEVGYESTSAFVAAFHREVGLTPTAYFRAK